MASEKGESEQQKRYPVPNDQDANTESHFDSAHGPTSTKDFENAKPTVVKRAGHRL